MRPRNAFGHASSLGEEVTDACRSGCDWAVYGGKDAEGRHVETTQYVFARIRAAAFVVGGVTCSARDRVRPRWRSDYLERIMVKDADGHSAQTKQYISDGLGGGAIIGGGVLYWPGHDEGSSRISLASSLRSGVVTWSGSW